jgi:methanethiol S-methyltransferase
MILQHMYLAALWVLYCVFHSLFAANWWKSEMSKLLGRSFRFYRFYYSVFSTFSLVFILYYLVTIESPQMFEVSVFSRLAASIGGIAGIIVMLACTKKYFSVVTGVEAFSQEKKSTIVLQTGGLHSYTRHPLYLGTLVFIWSLYVFFPSLSNLISCCMISFYTVVGMYLEERKLVVEFGEAYKNYSRTVPMLIPRLFTRRSKVRQSFPETV